MCSCIWKRKISERHVCTRAKQFHKKGIRYACVWRCAVCCGWGKQWSILSHYPTAYVWFIYIHGYPDNEAFNPGDPVVRTMNPITSRRLWDGMADSETDGRGYTRPAIQSHSSCLLPVSPVHVFFSNLSTGRGQRTWDHYITRNNSANTHVHERIPRGPLEPPQPRSPCPTAVMHIRVLASFEHSASQWSVMSLHPSLAVGGGRIKVLWAR